jgi:hypothetical protein
VAVLRDDASELRVFLQSIDPSHERVDNFGRLSAEYLLASLSSIAISA